ncbi:hypothetical protein [Streptomyces sp. WAC06614]|uniref:hypothetical protein n=1 Tax=Streptomyces sp. WAC06614 TaxID=2487416 RepID=UPI0021AEF506|nr:hypothetical protein [Streptomyces sp. WAC06614]
MFRAKRRLAASLSAAASAAVLSLAAAAPASASPPTASCSETHQARIVFWAVACSQPGQPVIGAFATWRNTPITFDSAAPQGTTVQASNYLTMVPNTEGGMFANHIELGLYAEKTGPTGSTYGPRWTEVGNSGGKTHAITQGIDPDKPNNVNHTYMTIRQASGDQWDVLYDFNWVGSTTDQLKVPRGNPNRIDIGLEVMGPQYVTVPEIANRVQYMAENKTWSRSATADTAQAVTLGICGQKSPWDPNFTYAPPNCFNAKLTDNTKFTQWTVSKPGAAGSSPVAPRTAPFVPQSAPGRVDPAPVGTFNGTDQGALARCMAEDPNSCLATVPGLAECVRTAKQCNAAALTPTASRPTHAPSARSATPPLPSPVEIRGRAAAAFGVPVQDVHVSTGSSRDTAGKTAPSADPQPEAGAVWTVESQATTKGLSARGTAVRGFRATYSAVSGQLLDACWGQMCAR